MIGLTLFIEQKTQNDRWQFIVCIQTVYVNHLKCMTRMTQSNGTKDFIFRGYWELIKRSLVFLFSQVNNQRWMYICTGNKGNFKFASLLIKLQCKWQNYWEHFFSLWFGITSTRVIINYTEVHFWMWLERRPILFWGCVVITNSNALYMN